MTSDNIWMLIRYGLLAVGGWLVQKGYTDNNTWTTVIGSLQTLFGFAWGVWVNWGTKLVPAHVAGRVDVPTVSPVTGVVQPPTAFQG